VTPLEPYSADDSNRRKRDFNFSIDRSEEDDVKRFKALLFPYFKEIDVERSLQKKCNLLTRVKKSPDKSKD